MNSIKGK